MVLSGEAKRKHNQLYHQKNKEKIHQRKKKNYEEKKRKEAELNIHPFFRVVKKE